MSPTTKGTVDVISNSSTGGSGGTPFTLTHGKNAAETITVWIAKGSGNWNDRDLVKGIEVTWADGTDIKAQGNITGATKSTFTFNDNETVSSLDLWTGDRVDKIKFTTSGKRTFEKGGTGGSVHSQSIGNGTLLGFHGDYNSDELVSIGSDFKEDSD